MKRSIQRDGKGRFSAGNGRYTGLVLFVFALFGVAMVVLKAADWGAEHQIIVQKPWDLGFKPVVLIVKREREILVPIVREEVNREALNGVEGKILDAFGERNFAVMRAVAVCESGLNPEAVNWETKDVGLYQIHWQKVGNEVFEGWKIPVKEQFGYTLSDMFDVDKNIEVAKWIWDRDGDGDGNIDPWVAVNTQCFKDEL